MARIVLGQHIVVDDEICHGKATFTGTRIMVWQILEMLAHGESHDWIVKAWGGRVSREAVMEAVSLAKQAFVDHAREYGQEAGANERPRRERSRRGAGQAAAVSHPVPSDRSGSRKKRDVGR